MRSDLHTLDALGSRACAHGEEAVLPSLSTMPVVGPQKFPGVL